MNKKTKGIIITLCCVIAAVIIICCGLLFSKNFRNLILPDNTVTEPTTAAAVRKESPVVRPDNIYGIFIKQDEDYQYKDLPVEEICRNIDSVIETASAAGVNTVFFDCLSNMGAVTAKDENGNSVNLLQYCVDAAHKKGLYTAISLDHGSNSEFLNAEKYTSSIRELIDTACFDAVVIPETETEEDLSQKLNECAAAVRGVIDELYSPVEIIVETPYSPLSSGNSFNNAAEMIKNRTADTLLITPSQVDISTEDGFKTLIDGLNKGLEGFSDDYIINYDISLCTEDVKSTEICLKNLKYADDNASEIGFIFSPFSAFATDSQGIQLINGYLTKTVDTEAMFKEFAITNYDSTEIKVDESKIVFRGTCSPSYPLTCNGNEVECSTTGDFALEYKLETGKNEIVFEQNGKTYKYTVTYDADIIKSVMPKTETLVMGDSEIQLSAVAIKGSKVVANVNGTSINMTEGMIDSGDSQSTPDESSDYTTFSCTYKVPSATDKEQNLGNFTVTATINGMTKNMKGAVIKVDKEFVLVTEEASDDETEVITTTEPVTTRPQWTRPTYAETSVTDSTLTSETVSDEDNTTSTTAAETTASQDFLTSKKLTPYSFNGVSGTAKMCEITENYAKTMPVSPLSESSVPMYTPQLSGTFDYIVGESSYQDKDGTYYYYNLASGLRIHRKNAKLIEKGYKLPANSIQSTTDYIGSELAIIVSPKWKVPFISKLTGQAYTSKSSYYVKEFTATGIEFIFYHTTKSSGKFNLANSQIIKDAQWSSNSDGTSTLSLTFRNAGRFYGYTVKYDKNDNLVIRIKNKPSSLSGYTIMLDPGHGGTEAGSVCAVNNQKFNWESKLNLAIATKIKDRLEADGAKVVMTRTTDKNILLAERVAMMRSTNPDMFISVHCDSVDSSSTIGTSAFYYTAQSEPLSTSIHNRIVKAYKDTIYKKAKYSSEYDYLISKVDRGSKYYPFYVTRVFECPAILVEYGFSSNIKECLELQSDSTQNVLADATVSGIKDYISKY